MIYMHWVPTGQTVNKEYYVEVLREFSKRFCRKRPALFKSGQWHFHQDNAPVHNSILVTDYSTKMGIKTVPHPTYSPDLAPCGPKENTNNGAPFQSKEFAEFAEEGFLLHSITPLHPQANGEVEYLIRQLNKAERIANIRNKDKIERRIIIFLYYLGKEEENIS